MMIEKEPTASVGTTGEPAAGVSQRALSEPARRALAEAEERRAAEKRSSDAKSEKAKEVGGRDGPEPTRYGDWEKGGIVSDF